MQEVRLPVTIEPTRAAQKRLCYKGVVPAARFQRLAEMAGVQKDVNVSLECDIDPEGRAVLKGQIDTRLQLECQRCNGNFMQDFSVQFSYSPSKGDEELPEAYEPIELDENGEVNLHLLIEDELMLALPIVAMHPPAECGVNSDELVYGDIEPADERPNPFAVLKQLKD